MVPKDGLLQGRAPETHDLPQFMIADMVVPPGRDPLTSLISTRGQCRLDFADVLPVIDDALGDQVRVTVIAAGFDKIGDGRGKDGRLARVIESELPGEREPVPSLLEDEEDDELFKPAPATVLFDAEEDLDIPDFLKS